MLDHVYTIWSYTQYGALCVVTCLPACDDTQSYRYPGLQTGASLIHFYFMLYKVVSRRNHAALCRWCLNPLEAEDGQLWVHCFGVDHFKDAVSDSDIPHTDSVADVAKPLSKLELPCSNPVSEEGNKNGTRFLHLAQNHLWWANPCLVWLRSPYLQLLNNYAVSTLSKPCIHLGECCLYQKMVNQIWEKFAEAQVHCFINARTTPCQLWFFLAELHRALWQDALPMTDLSIYYLPLLLYCSLSALHRIH